MKLKTSTLLLLFCLSICFGKQLDRKKFPYKFSYSTGSSGPAQIFHQEQRNDNGVVNGKYGFMDSNGKLRVVYYEAGPQGFKAVGDIGPDHEAINLAQKLQAQDIIDKMDYFNFWNSVANQAGVSPYWSQYANSKNLAPYWRQIEGKLNPSSYSGSVEQKLKSYWNEIQSNQIPQTPDQIVPIQDSTLGRAFDSFIKSSGYSTKIDNSIIKSNAYQTAFDQSYLKSSEYHSAVDHLVMKSNGHQSPIEYSFIKPKGYQSVSESSYPKQSGYHFNIDHNSGFSNPVMNNGYSWNTISNQPINLLKSSYSFSISHENKKRH